MTIWAWVAVGASIFALSAVLIGLAIARILGEIAHNTAELTEQLWSSAPLTRESETQDAAEGAEDDDGGPSRVAGPHGRRQA